MLYSKFGFMYHDLKVKDQDYILIRENDVIAVMPNSSECRSGLCGILVHLNFGIWLLTGHGCFRLDMPSGQHTLA